ncbi:hypothetical protein HRbin39_01744 [bacterium HR39]|nr:hypothetical protein HRbin39_01744 [bacterium HR39]
MFNRYEMAVPGRVVANDREFPCLVRDLSLGGARVAQGDPALSGRHVILHLDDLWHEAGLRARVVHADEQDLHLAFELDEAGEEALTFYLAAVAALR